MKEKILAAMSGGVDSSASAVLLLEQGYEVYGIMRRKSVVDYGNVEHIKDKIHFIYADMTDVISLISAMRISQADEVYNLAAQSFVATSWEQPLATAEIDALGVTNMLEAIRAVKPECRFYQASTWSVWYRKCRRLKRHRSIREARTALQSCMATGSPRTIGKATACLHAPAFCSTTSPSAAAWNLLPGRSPMQ